MRMFALRAQVKVQYKATQRARVAERKAGESKKSFISYIFHEVSRSGPIVYSGGTLKRVLYTRFGYL